MSDTPPEPPQVPPQPASTEAPSEPSDPYLELRALYREAHLAYVAEDRGVPTPESLLPGANRTAGELASELKEFCLAGGQDLNDLNEFLKAVEDETFVADMTLHYNPG